MGILDIDLDNITVTTERVKDRTVWVIDNFYRYPNAVASLRDKTKTRGAVISNVHNKSRSFTQGWAVVWMTCA